MIVTFRASRREMAKSALINRFGPLLVALTGAALIVLELFGHRTEDASMFWLVVGGCALVLGIVGHIQRS